MMINSLTFRHGTAIVALIGLLATASQPTAAQQNLTSPRPSQQRAVEQSPPSGSTPTRRADNGRPAKSATPLGPAPFVSQSRPSRFAPTQRVYERPAVLGVPVNPEQEKLNNAVKALKKAKSDSDKQNAKTAIKKMLEEQYDAYLDRHEEPLKKLEKQLAGLRKEFEARKAAKSDLVKLRLDTIWYQSQGLGWPEYTAPPTPAQYLPSLPDSNQRSLINQARGFNSGQTRLDFGLPRSSNQGNTSSFTQPIRPSQPLQSPQQLQSFQQPRSSQQPIPTREPEPSKDNDQNPNRLSPTPNTNTSATTVPT